MIEMQAENQAASQPSRRAGVHVQLGRSGPIDDDGAFAVTTALRAEQLPNEALSASRWQDRLFAG